MADDSEYQKFIKENTPAPLVFICEAEPSKTGRKRGKYRCQCGNEFESTKSDVKRGHTRSCGCFQRLVSRNVKGNTKHGYCPRDKPNTLYTIWQQMNDRCYNKNSTSFPHYGGRGISVCDRWRNAFESFKDDMGDRPIGMQIDRMNNDGDYEPDNCVWSTHTQNQRNKGNNVLHDFNGLKITIPEIKEISGSLIDAETIRSRIKKGWKMNDALHTPLVRGRPKDRIALS